MTMKTRAMHLVRNTVLLAAAIVVFGCRAPLHEKMINMNDSTQVVKTVKKEKTAISSDTIPQKIEKKTEIQQDKRKHFPFAPEKDYDPGGFN